MASADQGAAFAPDGKRFLMPVLQGALGETSSARNSVLLFYYRDPSKGW